MWQPLTLEGAIKYFGSVSEEFPDFGIMVYANSRAFRFDFGIDFWEAVAKKAPTIKHAKGGASPNNLLQALEVTNRTINFVPNDGGALAMAEVSRETTTACWSATMGPHPATALMNAIASGDMDRAKQISDELHSAGPGVRSFLSDSDFFASFNIQFEKIRMNSAGYVNAGPMRPPYDYVPKDFEDACIENGKRFAALEKKYAAMLAPTAGGGES
jgi:dihydrodipicolinate synthase/N-acetylneuraminate lyase